MPRTRRGLSFCHDQTFARIGDKLHVFRVLRYRGFRLYWFGHLTAVAGHQMLILAHGWLAWELTRSEYVLGALGLVAAAPAIALTLFGGAAADKLELRRFLMLLQFVTALLMFAHSDAGVPRDWVRVWHVFVVAASSTAAYRRSTTPPARRCSRISWTVRI